MKTTKTEKTAIGLGLYTAWDLIARAYNYMSSIDWAWFSIDGTLFQGWLSEVAVLIALIWPSFTFIDFLLNKRTGTTTDQELPTPTDTSPPKLPITKPIVRIFPPAYLKPGNWEWGLSSIRNRKHVEPVLNAIWDEVLRRSVYDIGISSGRRDIIEQMHNVDTGASPAGTLTRKGMSRHLCVVSKAVDFIVYDENGTYVRDASTHLNWLDYYTYVARLAETVANERSYDLVLGLNWKSVDAGHTHLSRRQFPNTEQDYARLETVVELA